MHKAASLEEYVDRGEGDTPPYPSWLEPTTNAVQGDRFINSPPISFRKRAPRQLEADDSIKPVQFNQLITYRAWQIVERVESQLADDVSDPSDVVPASPAVLTCGKLIRRIALRVALASKLKVAAFTEDSTGVCLMLQSLLMDRRLDIRITPNGDIHSVISTDEHMVVRTRQAREDDANLPGELAEWVTSRA